MDRCGEDWARQRRGGRPGRSGLCWALEENGRVEQSCGGEAPVEGTRHLTCHLGSTPDVLLLAGISDAEQLRRNRCALARRGAAKTDS